MGSRIRVALPVIALAALGACGRHADDDRPRVALVLKTLNSPFFIDLQAGAEAAAARLGVTLVVQAAEREMDVEKQMQIIENLVQTGVDVLCVVPSGSKEIVPALGKALRANIPVVVVDERLNHEAAAEAGVRPATFVGSDNVDGGRLAGRHLVDATGGRANVAVLEGIPGHESGDERLRGFREAIRNAPGIRVVASQTANWERDQGFTVFQNMLQAHPEIEAIAAAGRTGRIRVIGFDAVDDARKAIAAGVMDASVAQYPSEMGRLAVESAVKLLRGEPVPPEQPTKVGLVTRRGLGYQP